MGKSRPRLTCPKIINDSKLKSPFRYLAEGSLTLALWAIWLYWIMPVVTLFFWAVGIKYFHRTIIALGGLRELIKILESGGYVILIVLTINLLWINYNYFMIFKRLGNRRSRGPRGTDEQVCRFFHVEPKRLESVRKERIIQVSLDGGKLLFLQGKSEHT